MDAKICDRCGYVWYDSDNCNTDVRTFEVIDIDSKTNSRYDLCELCRDDLFRLLNNSPTLDPQDKTIRIFKQ